MPLIDPVTMSNISSSPSTSKPPPAAKQSTPIDILPTNLARIVTHIHPALLLSAYYFRFPALVADPIPTLTTALLPLAVAQIAYVVCCLPAVGTNAKALKKKLGASKKGGSEGSGFSPLPIFLALVLSLFAVPVLTIIQILFGAPITTHLLETLLSSTHLALLAVFPLVYVHGVDGAKWREVVSAYSPVDEVFGGLVGCCFGAWVGAVPIPLDWDREWQKWPVTIVTGAYAGYVVGKGVGGSFLKGVRIEFD